MRRFLVVEVGCLECSGGEAAPVELARTDDLAEVQALIAAEHYSNEVDRFGVDLTTGELVVA
jgi:hypothetical protein